MSDEHPPSGAQTMKVLAIGVAVASLLALVVALLSLLLILDLRGDTAALAEQSRKTTKAMKSLQENVTAIATRLPPQATAEPVADENAEPPVPIHIDAVDRARDCVLRPGDAKGLVDCIKASPPR